MQKSNIGKKFASLRNNNEAVSPVVGTILMVAVTVILAAVIAAFIFGFTGAMPVAPNVAYFTVERLANGSVTVTNVAPTIAEIGNIVILVGDNEHVLTAAEAGVSSFAVLSDTYGNITISPAYPESVVDGVTIPAGGVSSLTQNPTPITIKASVNGAAIQVIETVTV